MSAKNSLRNKAIRRDQRDENCRIQLKKKLAFRVQTAAVKEWMNKTVTNQHEAINEEEPSSEEEEEILDVPV